MSFEKSITILFSADIQRSLDFYIEKLGFEQKWDWGNPADFGGVTKDNVEVFFSLHDKPPASIWMCIVVDNVDVYYDSIKSKGALILSPPEDKEWFMREMIVQDPDGHFIRFGHNTNCD